MTPTGRAPAGLDGPGGEGSPSTATALWGVPRTLTAPTLRVLLPVGPAGRDPGTSSLQASGPRDAFLGAATAAQGGRGRGRGPRTCACASPGVLHGRAVREGCPLGQTPGGGRQLGTLGHLRGRAQRRRGPYELALLRVGEAPRVHREVGVPAGVRGPEDRGQMCTELPGGPPGEGKLSPDPTRRDLGALGPGASGQSAVSETRGDTGVKGTDPHVLV